MTPTPNITINRSPPGLRRLVEALRLEGECFGSDGAKVLRRTDDIRLPQKQGGSEEREAKRE